MASEIDTTTVLDLAAEGGAADAQPASPARMPLTFDQVYAEHAARVLNLLSRLQVAPSDVQDVAQEVFLAIHAKLPEFEWRSKLSTWIHTICLRKASDYRRKASIRRENLTAHPPEQTGGAGPEQSLRDQQHIAMLQEALASLPPTYMEIFVLYEIEELPMAEVAAIVGCPLFTGYTRHKKAVAQVTAFFRKRSRP